MIGSPADNLPAIVTNPGPASTRPPMARWWLPGLVVFASFAVFATIRAPIPGVNEPHYLCKARHFWQPTWCHRDFFLSSADAHTVFFATIGGLTRFLSFEQSAWVGRLAVWLLLAVGWTRLVTCLTGSARCAVWSAWLFLLIAAIGNFSGEWVIGGVEAKCFAYAFVWLALEALHRSRMRLAAIWLGLAVSFHPVVGGWSLLALAFAFVVWPGSARTDKLPVAPTVPRLVSLALVGVCSLPGLVPAIWLLTDRPAAEVSRLADEIQVFARLSHHLNPARFPTSAFAMYNLLLVVWLIVLGVRRRFATVANSSDSLFHRVVAGSVAIAFGGLLIGFLWPTPALMKFYPFRLGDILLPMAVAVTYTSCIERLAHFVAEPTRTLRSAWLPFAMWLACGAAFSLSCTLPVDPNPQRNEKLTAKFWRDWTAACGWIRENTRPDALFVTPRYSWSFKWFAQRAEFVSFKDCPQDTAGIVEWKRRTEFWQQWRAKHWEDGFSRDELAALQVATQGDFLIAHRLFAVKLTPIFRNDTFAVYRLP